MEAETGNGSVVFQASTYARSENINELASALAAAQGELQNPVKDQTAEVLMKSGGRFKYSYTDLASVLDACRPVLAKNGLAILQPVSVNQNRVVVTSLLAHKSGQWISSDLMMTAAEVTPQAIGSAVTYGRRYGLGPLIGIAAGEDDDGAEASGVTANKQDRKESREASKVAAQEIASRKIAEFPAPANPSFTPDEQGLLDRIGTDRNRINAELSDMNLKLVNLLGNDSKQVVSEALGKFKAKASTDLNIPQLRELAVNIHRKIRDAEAQIQPEAEDPELVILLDEITDIKSTIRVFNEIKFRLVGLVGEPKALEIYKRALSEQSKTASNQFQGDLEAAKKAFISLFNEYSSLAREKLQAPA
jgi:hypothetical protein